MAPTPKENTALVRRFLSDVLVSSDTDAVESFVAADGVHHDLVFGGDEEETVDDLGRAVLAAADVEVDAHKVVADEARAAVRATVTGTHSVSLLDLAPTGERFEIAVVWFCRVEDGRITEIRSLPDGLGLLRQLGAISNVRSTANEDPRR